MTNGSGYVGIMNVYNGMTNSYSTSIVSDITGVMSGYRNQYAFSETGFHDLVGFDMYPQAGGIKAQLIIVKQFTAVRYSPSLTVQIWGHFNSRLRVFFFFYVICVLCFFRSKCAFFLCIFCTFLLFFLFYASCCFCFFQLLFFDCDGSFFFCRSTKNAHAKKRKKKEKNKTTKIKS